MKISLEILKKQDKQVLILMALGGLILFILYLNLLFRPVVARLKEINPKLSKLTYDIKRVERWVKESSETEGHLKGLQSKISRYEIMLSAEEEIPSLLEELSEIARASDVKIIGIRPERMATPGPEEKASYQEIPISIKAKCGYHALGYFISKLESSGRLLAVKDIDIKDDPQTPRSHAVNLMVSAFLVSED